jgi:Bacterial Ig-like domain (group 2)
MTSTCAPGCSSPRPARLAPYDDGSVFASPDAVIRIQGLLVLVAISAVACGERSSVSPTPVPTAISLSIDGNASFSLRGETSQLKALVTLSDRRVEDATATVGWSSSNVSVVTVSPLGVVTARGDGRAMVTATLNAIVATKPALVDLPTP